MIPGSRAEEQINCHVCQICPSVWVTEPGGTSGYFCKDHNPMSVYDGASDSSDSGETNTMVNHLAEKVIDAYMAATQPLIENASSHSIELANITMAKLREKNE